MTLVKNAEHTAGNTWGRIERYLHQQPVDTLVSMILTTANQDPILYQQLLLSSTVLLDQKELANTYQTAIQTAISAFASEHARYGNYRFHDDEILSDGLQSLQTVLTKLHEQVNTHPQLVMEQCEYAYDELVDVVENAEEYDDDYGNRLDEIGELHCLAAQLAKSNPIELAEKLLHYELTSNFGFNDCLTRYAEALGQTGLAHYAQLAEQAWQKYLQQRKINQNQRPTKNTVNIPPELFALFGDISLSIAQPVEYESHYCLKRIMEKVARQVGDIEKLVAIKSTDLSSAYHYVDIAETYQQAGLYDKAFDWAERGLHAFPVSTDNRLRTFLAERYVERGLNDKAVLMIWLIFAERPNLEHYQQLQSLSTRLNCWPTQRQRALALAQKLATENTKRVGRELVRDVDMSLLVQIALWENDTAQALVYSQQGRCSLHIGLQLATALTSSQPEEAILLYKHYVRDWVEQTNNGAYAEAEKLIQKIRAIWQQQGQRSAFSDYLSELGVAYKLKRNFIAILKALAKS